MFYIVKEDIRSGRIHIESYLGELLKRSFLKTCYCILRSKKLRNYFRKKQHQKEEEEEEWEEELVEREKLLSRDVVLKA